MKQIGQIISRRIDNILEIQFRINNDANKKKNLQKKYEKIVEQKKLQKNRMIRQNQLLLALNKTSLGSSQIAEEIYQITVDTIILYDKEYQKYRQKFSVSMAQNLRKLYCNFFNSHGFKHKSKQVNQTFQKGINNISPAILLGWLSQWSKKIYSEILQQQIKQTFDPKEQVEGINVQGAICIKNYHGLNPTKVIERKNNPQQITLADISQNELFVTAISSRLVVHSLFLDQLQQVYKVHDILGLDCMYLKNIKKRCKRQYLLQPANLAKAAEVLIETTLNKQLSSTIKNYEKIYQQKYPVVRETIKVTKSSQKKNYYNLSPLKKKNRITTEQKQQIVSKSKLLSPKISEFQFLKPQQLELRIKKLKLINNGTNKQNLEFPEIIKNKSVMEKNQISHSKINSTCNSNTSLAVKSPYSRQKLSMNDIEKKAMSDQQFLVCESIHSKSKILTSEPYGNKRGNSPIHNLNKAGFQSPKKLRKSKLDKLQIQYNDQRMKISKNFQLNTLMRNRKALVIKNRIVSDLNES